MEDAAAKVGGNWSAWKQLSVQSAAFRLSIVYVVVLTFGVLFVVDRIFKLRATADEEMRGLDTVYHGEIGDGKIFIVNLEECIRIRTGERGSAAI